jgi:hypothetical protein
LAIPALIPVTMPDAPPTVATLGVLLVHTPPVGVDPNGVVLPWHTLNVPLITEGSGLIATLCVTEQVVGNV